MARQKKKREEEQKRRQQQQVRSEVVCGAPSTACSTNPLVIALIGKPELNGCMPALSLVLHITQDGMNSFFRKITSFW
jgi:hypothetical protein